jgi:hypothetical protein
MARKKHRDIIVDGIKYGWTTYNMGKYISIWKDKRVIFETENNTPNYRITPSYIKKIIKENAL